MFSLAAGVLSVLAAGLVQSLFPPAKVQEGLGGLLFGVFIRVSLTEELSRLLCLYFVFLFYQSGKSFSSASGAGTLNTGASVYWAASGLVAGFGFAAAENIFYGLENPGLLLYRIFAAAPLHGACGARVGSSLFLIRSKPAAAGFLFFTAVLIHGIYDFFILNPGIPSFIPFLIAMAVLASSILSISHGFNAINWNNSEDYRN